MVDSPNETAWEKSWDEATIDQRRTTRRWRPQKKVTWGCKLTGDQNQCCQCGDWFNSSSSFAAHRRGDFENMRKCLDTSEMIGKGMVRNADYWWMLGTMVPNVFK